MIRETVPAGGCSRSLIGGKIEIDNVSKRIIIRSQTPFSSVLMPRIKPRKADKKSRLPFRIETGVPLPVQPARPTQPVIIHAVHLRKLKVGQCLRIDDEALFRRMKAAAYDLNYKYKLPFVSQWVDGFGRIWRVAGVPAAVKAKASAKARKRH